MRDHAGLSSTLARDLQKGFSAFADWGRASKTARARALAVVSFAVHLGCSDRCWKNT